MSEPYKLDLHEFHASLPKEIVATFYLEVESMEELNAKLNALVGRSYLLTDDVGVEVMVNGIHQVVVMPVTEFYVMPDPGETNLPVPHKVYHAIVIPEWKYLMPDEPTTPGRDGAQIVAD